MRTLAVFALAFSAIAIDVWAEVPDALIGIRLGMTINEAMAASGGLQCKQQRCFYFPVGPNPPTMGGAVVKHIAVQLFDDSVAAVLVTFRENDYERVMAAAAERFGKPQNVQRSEIQNRLGAKFEQITTLWSEMGRSLIASRYSGDLDSSSLMLMSKQFHEESKRAGADRAKKDAKAF
jgi:hypothetical protein